jgi:hypothetical protein
MNSKPAFQIVETWPTYHAFTDAMIGSTSRAVRYCNTEAFARRLAGKLHQADYENCGESSFEVRSTTKGKRLDAPVIAPTYGDDEIPF